MRFKPAASDEKAKHIGDEILPARLTATKRGFALIHAGLKYHIVYKMGQYRGQAYKLPRTKVSQNAAVLLRTCVQALLAWLKTDATHHQVTTNSRSMAQMPEQQRGALFAPRRFPTFIRDLLGFGWN
jgi:hypothetical protein